MMKICSHLCRFWAPVFLLLTVQTSTSAAGSLNYVMMDLDRTLIVAATPESMKEDPRDLFQENGQWYRITALAPEVLTYITTKMGLRLIINSSRPRATAVRIVNQILKKIPPGMRNQVRPLGIFGAENLVSGDLTFTNRIENQSYKTIDVIRRIDSDFDPKRVVWIDDVAEFAMPGQEKNLLHLPDTYDDYPIFESYQRAVKLARALSADPIGNRLMLERIPTDLRKWRTERLKLVWALGVLIEAQTRVQADPKIFLSEAVWATVHRASGLVTRDDKRSEGLLNEGAKALDFRSADKIFIDRFAKYSCGNSAERSLIVETNN